MLPHSHPPHGLQNESQLPAFFPSAPGPSVLAFYSHLCFPCQPSSSKLSSVTCSYAPSHYTSARIMAPKTGWEGPFHAVSFPPFPVPGWARPPVHASCMRIFPECKWGYPSCPLSSKWLSTTSSACLQALHETLSPPTRSSLPSSSEPSYPNSSHPQSNYLAEPNLLLTFTSVT